MLIAVAMLAGVLLIFAWWLFHHSFINFKVFTPGYIRDQVLSFGSWAAFVYIVVYVINAILIFPPNAPITLSAGLIFGPYGGAVLIMISALIAASITFWIGRSIEKKFLDRMLKGRWRDVGDKLEKNGFITVMLLRVVPIVPFEFLNYLCGLSRIKYSDYFWATFIGMIPGAIVMGYFGGTLGNVNQWSELFTPRIIIGVILGLLLILLPGIILIIRSRNTKL